MTRVSAHKRRRVMPVKIVKTRRKRPNRVKTGIVPDKRHVTMRYFFQKTLDISTVPDQHTFRANGLFDPDETGIGTQPRGFDQYAVFYNNYAVTSARIVAHGYSVGSSEPYLLSIRAHLDTTALDQDGGDVVELPGNVFTLASSYRDSHKRVATSVNIAKFLNRSGGIQDDADLIGTFSTDPLEQVHFTVTAVPVGQNNGTDVRIVGWIDFKVMLLSPKKVGGS